MKCLMFALGHGLIGIYILFIAIALKSSGNDTNDYVPNYKPRCKKCLLGMKKFECHIFFNTTLPSPGLSRRNDNSV